MMLRFIPPDGTAHATVILDRPAPPGGLVVALESLDTGVVTVPASVSLGEGYIGQGFPVEWQGVGATQIRATLDGVEKLLDVSAAGVIPSLRPETRLDLVELRPSPVVGDDETLRPDTTVGVELRPDDETAEPEPEVVPRPTVATLLRPKPISAGEE